MKKETKSHPDYGGFNDLPLGYQHISFDEFIKQLFHYCLSEPDLKQVWIKDGKTVDMSEGQSFTLRLFNLDYASCPAMGYGIELSYEGMPRTEVVKYFRYGDHEKWKNFTSEFAAQFAGDNS